MPISDYLGKFWTGAEVMYGIIIAMTFTSTLRHPSFDTQTAYWAIVFSALFCCIAWGVADGFFYAWEDRYIARNQRKVIEASKSSDTNKLAYSMIKEELDKTILSNIGDNDRKRLYEGITEYLSKTDNKNRKRSGKSRLGIIAATILLSSGAGVIVLLPFFILANDVRIALEISVILGIMTLYLIGWARAQGEMIPMRIVSGIGAASVGMIIAIITTTLGG